jgi:hypothetical protein
MRLVWKSFSPPLSVTLSSSFPRPSLRSSLFAHHSSLIDRFGFMPGEFHFTTKYTVSITP